MIVHKVVWLVYRILSFTVRAHATLRRIQTLNGLSIVFYRSQSAHTRRSDVYKTLMASPSYFIVLTRDAPTYTSTTDKCGARSGSPQLNMKYNTPIQVCYSLIIHVHHSRFPANKHVHETHPSHNTTNKLQYLILYCIVHRLPYY